MDSGRPTRVSDERLVEIARDGNVEAALIADELIYRRKMARHDSRRADQVKRLRWVAENLLSKIEALAIRGAEHEQEDLADGA